MRKANIRSLHAGAPCQRAQEAAEEAAKEAKFRADAVATELLQDEEKQKEIAARRKQKKNPCQGQDDPEASK